MLQTENISSLPKPRLVTWSRIDPVVVSIAILFAALAVIDLGQLPVSLKSTAMALLSISPFFLLSVAVAAYAKASGAEHLIANIFAGNPVRMIVLAALFGAISPFCSCGVIPLVAGLLIAGVPLAPVMAFWLSSPLMDPEMFIISAAAIGLPFTIAKTVAAIGVGLMGGFLTHMVIKSGGFTDPLRVARVASCGTSSCGQKSTAPVVNWKPWQDSDRRSAFIRSASDNGWFLGRWLTLAFAIESLMVAYIPASLISDWLGSGAWWTIPLAVGVGVPAYLNGFAAVPLIASLIDMGMMPGAAMAFMIAGGVTSLPAALAVFALARKPLFLWYILLSLTGALISGISYQAVAGFF
ncbi:MAG: permease [Rhodospirillales bacterium]|nr:permease [Rhodospirillales bacterium]